MLVSQKGDFSIMAEFERNLPNLNEERQLDAVIARFGIWYVEFLVSWQRISRAGRLPCRFVTYEDLMADKAGTLGELAGYIGGVRPSDGRVREVIAELEGDGEAIRFNKGRTGRGVESLTQRQIDRIRSLTEFYDDVDFSPIGL